MKIVHIITRLILGGAQENTLITCQLLAERGHEVTLITGPALGPEGQLFDLTKGQKYRTIVVDEMRRAILPFKDYASYGKIKALLRELKPDIVHTHSAKAGIVGRFAAWSLKGEWDPRGEGGRPRTRAGCPRHARAGRPRHDSRPASCILCTAFPSIPIRTPGPIASTSPSRRPRPGGRTTSSASPTR